MWLRASFKVNFSSEELLIHHYTLRTIINTLAPPSLTA